MTNKNIGPSTHDEVLGGQESVPLDPEVYRALGMTDDEAQRVVDVLGRTPNNLELAMYSVMWSEHCSYKSSRIHLRRLPTEAPHVLVGPGEGAGVVDVGDGIALALRIESHNHPSFTEPFEGASTGVGGILRDIFSMGARPIAVCDPVRFGPLDDAYTRWLAQQVAAGAATYSRAVSVPIIGGETVFDATYIGNPLVNVVALGILEAENLMLGRATGAGNHAVMLGAPTGRDGIGGVSVVASASIDSDDDPDEAPVTPAGDPELGRRLIEASLELYDRDLAVGVQDLGGAGITCATSETAAKAGTGMDVFVDRVSLREAGMTPVETVTSETQERMLIIVEPDRLDEVLAVAKRWEIPASIIGRVTDTGQLRVLTTDADDAEVLADVPAKSLEEGAPVYDRPRTEPAGLAERRAADPADNPGGPVDPDRLGADLLALLTDTESVWSQFDLGMSDVVVGPGADAAVLRLRNPGTGADTGRGIALTSDGNHRWCAVDPRAGTAAVIAESVLNLACVGAQPVAVVNNLNFGSPENPEVMWQFSEAVDGMAEACRAFDVPIIGGNVSFYNASDDADIDPTPIVGTLGMIDTLDDNVPGPRILDDGHLVLLGVDTASGSDGPGRPSGLAGSRWAFDRGLRDGSLVPVDFAAHTALCGLVRDLVTDGVPDGITDISEGGLAGILAEAVAGSGVGAQVTLPAGADPVPWLFGEAPSRVLVCVDDAGLAALRERASGAGVPMAVIGRARGGRLTVTDSDDEVVIDLGVDEIATNWRDRLPDAFALDSDA